MRATKIGLWLLGFLAAGAVPAFCQVIVQPNGSGHTVPTDAVTSHFEESVASTGTFDYSLVLIKNFRPVYAGSGVVCTSGPAATVAVDIPMAGLDLKAGDLLTFVFAVKHRQTEGGTTSVILSIIPVVQGAISDPPPPPPPPPPPTSKRLPAPAALRQDATV